MRWRDGYCTTNKTSVKIGPERAPTFDVQADDARRPKNLSRRQQLTQLERLRREFLLGATMSINKLFAVLRCQPTTPNRLRGEARNGRRATYLDRSLRLTAALRER